MITLPPNAVVSDVKPVSGCGDPVAWRQAGGVIELELPWLCPGKCGVSVDVTVRRSQSGRAACQPAFSVFVYSAKPDSRPANNYWWWMDRCGNGSQDYTLINPECGPGPCRR